MFVIQLFMRHIYLLFLLFTVQSHSQNHLDFYFKSRNVKGGIVIRNEEGNYYASNNELEPNRYYPPAATFNMFNYLLVKYYQDKNQLTDVLPWDGVKRHFFNEVQLDWNKNTNVNEAFLTNNDWYFQEYLNKLPQKYVSNVLEQIKYTNSSWNNEIPYYWQFGGLLCSSDQQISFLKKLRNNELPFNTNHQKELIELMKVSSKGGLDLYGIDGHTVYLGERVEWFIGFLEKDSKRYYFSIRTYFSIEEEWNATNSNYKYDILSDIFDSLHLI